VQKNVLRRVGAVAMRCLCLVTLPLVAGEALASGASDPVDRAAYKDVEYVNASKPGPSLVVLTGKIKSTNATFTQQVNANNIADFAELELTKANFNVLERERLADLMEEFNTAYNMGDQEQARKLLEKGKVASTRWMVKFDILRAEPVAQQAAQVSGRGISQMAGALGSLTGLSSRGVDAARAGVETVDTANAKSTWIVGMRYTILNAATTEQVASGYSEEKMEVGGSATTAAGVSQSHSSGATLDSMVMRLVQKSVAEIDARNK